MRKPTKREQDKFYADLASGKFSNMVRESIRGQKISNQDALYHILKPLAVAQDDREAFWVIFLTSKNKVIAIDKMFEGSITSSSVYPREVIKAVLKYKAVAIILAHNHPSGDTTPSSEDIVITRALVTACASIGVTIHDHMIISDGFSSMATTGIIARLTQEYTEYSNS